MNFPLVSVVTEAPRGHGSKPRLIQTLQTEAQATMQQDKHINTDASRHTPAQPSLYSSDVFTEPKGWLLKIIQPCLSLSTSGRSFFWTGNCLIRRPKGSARSATPIQTQTKDKDANTKTHTLNDARGSTSLSLFVRLNMSNYITESLSSRDVTWPASAEDPVALILQLTSMTLTALQPQMLA